jgi:hypothetical protein
MPLVTGHGKLPRLPKKSFDSLAASGVAFNTLEVELLAAAGLVVGAGAAGPVYSSAFARLRPALQLLRRLFFSALAPGFLNFPADSVRIARVVLRDMLT